MVSQDWTCFPSASGSAGLFVEMAGFQAPPSISQRSQMRTRPRKRHLSQWNESHSWWQAPRYPSCRLFCLMLVSCSFYHVIRLHSVVALNNRLPGMLVKDVASVQAERASVCGPILGVLLSSPSAKILARHLLGTGSAPLCDRPSAVGPCWAGGTPWENVKQELKWPGLLGASRSHLCRSDAKVSPFLFSENKSSLRDGCGPPLPIARTASGVASLPRL